MQIVTEIGAIVGQNINMMDETGVIIASTDLNRIGDEHAAAKRIIDEGLEELYVTPEENTSTTRTGLNLGVRYLGETVAVIGITGHYDAVKDYGQIVRKMTEILIRENLEQEMHKFDMRVYSRFLEEWVLSPAGTNLHIVKERGAALGIDTEIPRRVLIVSLRDLEEYVSSTTGQKRIDEVEAEIAKRVLEQPNKNGQAKPMILRKEATQILLLPQQSDESVRTLANQLIARIDKSFRLPLSIGFDAKDPDIHKAYLQANRAWRSAKMAGVSVFGYDQMTLELFMPEISKQTKLEYLFKVFSQMGLREIAPWMEILKAYFACDGSIAQASEALFMHKNTFQYQLKKIKEITGYDVRKPSEGAVLYMAMMFYNEVMQGESFGD